MFDNSNIVYFYYRCLPDIFPGYFVSGIKRSGSPSAPATAMEGSKKQKEWRAA
jgi:hypothetical protein